MGDWNKGRMEECWNTEIVCKNMLDSSKGDIGDVHQNINAGLTLTPPSFWHLPEAGSLILDARSWILDPGSLHIFLYHGHWIPESLRPTRPQPF